MVMTDEQRDQAIQSIMMAMWHAEVSGGNPLAMADLSQVEREERRSRAEEALDKVIDIIGMKNAMPDMPDHRLLVKAFRRGQPLRGEKHSQSYLLGVLMGVCGGHADPRQLNKFLNMVPEEV